MKAGHLTDLQAMADRQIAFSVTLDCPNKCEHCLVESGPEKKFTTISPETAQRYAAQMRPLYQAGIRQIGLTGGEPLVAPEPLAILSEAAASSGIKCGVVTSASWAVDASTADKVVRSFPHISFWDISIDAYHKRYIPLSRVRNAFYAVKKAAKFVNLRVSYHVPVEKQDEEILRDVGGFAAQDEVTFQIIRKEGRGKKIAVEDLENENLLNRPCLTRGMIVRWDGSIGPCCVNLTEERNHPFQFGNAQDRPLADILHDYTCHPLLQMMRVVGFSDILGWVREAGLEGELGGLIPDDVCYLCHHLYKKPAVSRYLAARAAQPLNRLKIAILVSKVLGRHNMLQQTVEELRCISGQLPGFEQAAALVKETA